MIDGSLKERAHTKIYVVQPIDYVHSKKAHDSYILYQAFVL